MKEEISRYITLPVLDRCKNPAEWWETIGKGLLPRMYELAKGYLVIPTTSVPSKFWSTIRSHLVHIQARTFKA